MRTRDLHALVRAVDRHVGGHRPPGEGIVRFAGLAAIGPAGAIVVSGRARQGLARYQGRLRALGFEMLDAPWVDVDRATAEVVVRDPGLLDVDAVVAALDGRPHVPGRAVTAGRHPVIGWVQSTVDAPGLVERATATALLNGELERTMWPPAPVEALVELAGAAPVLATAANHPPSVVEAVEQLVGRGG